MSWEEETVPNLKISIALGVQFNLESETPFPVSVICISCEQRTAVEAIGINGNRVKCHHNLHFSTLS